MVVSDAKFVHWDEIVVLGTILVERAAPVSAVVHDASRRRPRLSLEVGNKRLHVVQVQVVPPGDCVPGALCRRRKENRGQTGTDQYRNGKGVVCGLTVFPACIHENTARSLQQQNVAVRGRRGGQHTPGDCPR